MIGPLRVSKDYKYVGMVHRESSPELPYLHSFNLYPSAHFQPQEEFNITIDPEFTIKEMGKFLSIDMSDDTSLISYIRAYGYQAPQK